MGTEPIRARTSGNRLAHRTLNLQGMDQTASREEPTGPEQHHSPREEMARELVSVMGEIHRRGWCDGTSGNFSCVLRHQPLTLLMAPSGAFKGSLGSEDLIEVNREGLVVAGQGKASAETALHLAIVAVAGAGAVLHTHSLAATLLSGSVLESCSRGQVGDEEGSPDPFSEVASSIHDRNSLDKGPETAKPTAGSWIEFRDLEMLKGLEGITTHRVKVRIPLLANDQDMGRLAKRATCPIRSAPHGLLIRGHGLYAWGKNLKQAQRHLEILEFLLELRWRQLLLPAHDIHSQPEPIDCQCDD